MSKQMKKKGNDSINATQRKNVPKQLGKEIDSEKGKRGWQWESDEPNVKNSDRNFIEK